MARAGESTRTVWNSNSDKLPKLVNVATWDGRHVALPEEDAAALVQSGAARPEDSAEESERANEERIEHEHRGLAAGLVSAGAGALDALTVN